MHKISFKSVVKCVKSSFITEEQDEDYFHQAWRAGL